VVDNLLKTVGINELCISGLVRPLQRGLDEPFTGTSGDETLSKIMRDCRRTYVLSIKLLQQESVCSAEVVCRQLR
jgi:hypothetical protein